MHRRPAALYRPRNKCHPRCRVHAGGVCGVGLICIAAAKGDSYDALAGVDERTAAVGRGNVGVIIGIPQPNSLTINLLFPSAFLPIIKTLESPPTVNSGNRAQSLV